MRCTPGQRAFARERIHAAIVERQALMAKISELAGVAHNVAHHAASGLSYLSPHLAQAVRGSGKTTTAFELLTTHPYPPDVVAPEPLRLALLTLRQTVLSLLAKHGYDDGEVTSVMLHATPDPSDRTGHTLAARTVVSSAGGRTFDSGWLSP